MSRAGGSLESADRLDAVTAEQTFGPRYHSACPATRNPHSALRLVVVGRLLCREHFSGLRAGHGRGAGSRRYGTISAKIPPYQDRWRLEPDQQGQCCLAVIREQQDQVLF